MKPFVFLFSIFIFGCASSNENAEGDQRPNILLIVADDLGYADLGVFGGDISTPNIDQLARSGLLFTRFHTAVMCAPTRAMLLSGNENHIAGVGSQSGGTGIFENQFGYEGYLTDRVIPFPVLLQDAGYHTYIAGKWHLGRTKETSPAGKGFEQSWVMEDGAGNHYNDVSLFENDSSTYRENGELVNYPQGEYSTEFYTNKLLEYIEGNLNDGKPFFAFAALTTPHWPLQVPQEFDNYRGRYNIGYDSLRQIRFKSLRKAGIIPDNAKFPKRLENIPLWNELSEEQKKIESRKMELYSAMVENLDYHVGRMVQFLKERKVFENTLIIFMSDNGAAGEDYYNILSEDSELYRYYDNSYENMGKPNSFISYGPQWAMAGAAPFNRYKTYPTEGGISAPLIMSGAGIHVNGEISHEYLTVMDLAPTFLEIARTEYPGNHNSQNPKPLAGVSLLTYLNGEGKIIHDDNYVTYHEHRLRFYIRKGDWKLVSITQPVREEDFQLYNLAVDLAESKDLKKEFPEVFHDLLSEWNKYREETKIIIPQ